MADLMAQKRQDFRKLCGELEAGQKEMEAGPLAQSRGEELTQKAKEAEKLQAEIEQYDRLSGFGKKGREMDEVEDTNLPAGKEQRERAAGSRKRLVTTPGHLFVASDGFKRYRENGKQGWSAMVDVKSTRGGRVRLTGKEAEAFEKKAFDAGTLSDLGEDAIIQTDRDNEIVRFEEPEILTLRDLCTILPTSSDAVRFIRHTAVTRAAASQASRGAAKSYLDVTFEADTVNVETIAVLSKVTEQDIDDAPRLIGIINGEMTLDVRVEEDRQIAWGSGASGQLDGVFHQGIPEFDRAGVGDTLIDTIRRMRTDIRLQRMMPDSVAIHPLDWEEVELAKGDDERYVWAVVQTVSGPRIWSLRVVESEGMENPATGERRLVVGDWKRAVTLYDRHDVRLAVGFVDDDFARNLRTLRAEERLALALKRDFALTYTETQAAGT